MLKGNDLLYKKIERYLDGLISDGTLKVGDRLLSERDIGKRFNASLIPVRRAMQKFLDEGILEKVQGRGTFVKKVRANGKERSTGRIGVLYPHSRAGFFASTFYNMILAGIEQEAALHKKTLLLRSMIRSDSDGPAQAFREIEEDVDGIIVADLMPYVLKEALPAIRNVKKPLVLLNYEIQLDDADMVVTDSTGNTRRLVQHLIDKGHTKIAVPYIRHMEDGPMHRNFDHRLNAYKETLAANNIPVREDLIYRLTHKDRHPYLLRDLLALQDPPTAIYCTGTFMATRMLYPEAQKAGVKIPDDISIVTYDDLPECEDVHPGLTAIDTSVPEMARLGMKRLMDKMSEENGSGAKPYQIVLPGKVIERGSVKNLQSTGDREQETDK